MSFNYEYVIDFLKKADHDKNIRVLDFGCGPGNIVQMGVDSGIDIYGVDIFQGISYKEETIKKGLFGKRIFEIHGSKIEFPDNYFNVIIANQVIEHVENLDIAVNEIARVLVKGGFFLSLFPTKETWMEVHSKIPLIHKINNKNLQLNLFMISKMILGKANNDGRSYRKNAEDFLDWMKLNCFYRSIREIKELLSEQFESTDITSEYIKARLKTTKISCMARMIGIFPFNILSTWLFKKLGGFVILSKKL